MNDPLVSICIPTFNRAGMVEDAIASALAQTYKNIEVIVVDNASTDNTEEIVHSFRDERLRYVRNERNLGLFGNFNRCIECAAGEFVHVLHSDDSIDSDFTRKCVAFFLEHPTVAMTSTGARIIGSGPERVVAYRPASTVFPAPEGFCRLLAERSFIVCPSVMIRTHVLKEIGPFRLEYPYSSDYYQWLRIARRYDIGFVSGANVVYRQGEHSETFRFLFSSSQGYLDMIRIFVQIRIDLGEDVVKFSPEILAAQRRFVNDCIYAGFTRADTMTGFAPGIFTCLALTCWKMEEPATMRDLFRNVSDRLMILGAGILISCDPLRKSINRLFFTNRQGY